MISAKKIIKAGSILAKDPKLIFGKHQYLFLISHMRSYSSVLSHILGSHEEIDGYSEMHQSYKNWLDFLKLRIKVTDTLDGRIKAKMILDKILHNYCFINDKVLLNENVHLAVFIRNPKDTMKSILNLSRNKNLMPWLLKEEKVLDYYADRLKTLKHYANIAGKKILFFRSQFIVENTPAVLCFLKDHLGLQGELMANYSTFKYTGSGGYGDMSDSLKRGKVLAGQNDEKSKIILSKDVLKKANDIYQDVLEVFKNKCNTLEVNPGKVGSTSICSIKEKSSNGQ